MLGCACSLVRRLLVLVLSLSLATSGAMPLWALLAGIEAAHVCHCSLEKHDCVCAKCNPEHEDTLSTESLKGRCGDDDAAFGGRVLVGVLSSPDVVSPPAASHVMKVFSLDAPVVSAPRAPPTPPPRLVSPRTV